MLWQIDDTHWVNMDQLVAIYDNPETKMVTLVTTATQASMQRMPNNTIGVVSGSVLYSLSGQQRLRFLYFLREKVGYAVVQTYVHPNALQSVEPGAS